MLGFWIIGIYGISCRRDNFRLKGQPCSYDFGLLLVRRRTGATVLRFCPQAAKINTGSVSPPQYLGEGKSPERLGG